MRKKFHYLLLGIGGAYSLTCSDIYAAEPHQLADFTTSVHQETTTAGHNPAFLTVLSLPAHLSYLQVSAHIGQGSFYNYQQSKHHTQGGIHTESYYRLNRNITLYGAMGYLQSKGKDMEGTAFINPSAPFHIVEANSSNKGDKKMETYHLQGGIGWKALPQLSIGASIDYTAANYAKYKDLRHKNTLMNMQVAAGINWQINQAWAVGLSYHYHRNNEAVEFATYGNKDIQYYSLISYGNFYGLKEAFGESGYTASRTPLFTEWHGLSLQGLWHLSPRLQWFSEVFFHSPKGRFGKGTSTSVTFTTHEGTDKGYNGRLSYRKGNCTHIIDGGISCHNLKNYENSYKESTDESNVTQIIYYGSNEVMDRKEWKGKLDYTLYAGRAGRNPKWITGIRTSFYARNTTTSVYPYYRKQDLHQIEAIAHAARSIPHRKGVYTLRLQAGYGTGGGTLKEDGLYTTPGSNQQAPFSREDLLLQEFEYYTAPRSLAGTALRYEYAWSEKLELYGEVSYQYTRAYRTTQTGTDRHDIGLHIGCRF